MPDRKNVLLVHTPKTNEYYPLLGRHRAINYIPMGLFSIAGQASRAGHAVKIVHLGVQRERNPRFSLSRLAGEVTAHTVGFSLHWHHQSHDVIREIRQLRAARPEVQIVVGGFTASYFAEELIADHAVDAVCVGEGERTFSSLLERQKGDDLDGIANLVWKKGPQIVTNKSRHAPSGPELDDYDFFPAEQLISGDDYVSWAVNPWFRLDGITSRFQNKFLTQDRALFPLMTLRGCIQDCSFCGGSQSAYSLLCQRRSMAVRSAESAARTVSAALRAGFRSIFMEYVAAPEANQQACRLAEDLARNTRLEGLVVECRTLPSEDFLDALSSVVKSGKAVRIHLSPDRADQTMRARHKTMAFSDDEMFATLELCEKKAVNAEVFFICGWPEETTSEIIGLKALIARLLKMPAVGAARVHSVPLEPGSPMFQAPAQFAIERYVNRLEDFVIMHGQTRFPPQLGYAPVGRAPSDYDRAIQSVLCDHFCRASNYSHGAQGVLRSAASLFARGACSASRKMRIDPPDAR